MASFSVRKVANGWTVDTCGGCEEERFIAHTVDDALAILRRNMETKPVLTGIPKE